jgi:diguanylate cyclase (GGDEF)-like protein/PAS domain S-box-containing protein
MRTGDPTDARFALLDHSPIGHFVLRKDYSVLFWNRCLEAWTGISREKIVGGNILEHFPHLGTPKYAGRIEAIFAGGPPTIFSSQLHKHVIPAPLPGGKLRFQYTVVTCLPNGEEFLAFFAVQDVTSLTEAIESHQAALRRVMVEMEERKKAEAALVKSAKELRRLNRVLKERSIRDGLTSLYNHRHFYHVLRRDFLTARRHGSDLACLLLDLDHFKLINDKFGHPFGDLVLREVAEFLREKIRKSDIVSRYGGEEFAILFPGTGLSGALSAADHLRERIAGHAFGDGRSVALVTVSIGVATMHEHSPPDAQGLLSFADRALYRAKEEGRNRVVVFSPEM